MIFDSYGRTLYNSIPWNNAITAISWAKNGAFFAAGSLGVIKLCDVSGWTYSTKNLDKGSIMDLRWSPDSSLLAAATAQGDIILGEITDRKIEQ